MYVRRSAAILSTAILPFWIWATGTSKRWGLPPLLVLVLAVALALRVYGINWDQGNLFHPDERSIYMRADCMYMLLTETQGYQSCMADEQFQNVVPGFPTPTVFLDAAKSPLNPHWFPLGSMVIYMLVAIKLFLGPVMELSLQDLAIAGRLLSAMADFASVLLVYALGKRIYGHGTGLLASTLVAFTVVHIQLSHFYRPETFNALFSLGAFWFMLNVIERRRLRDSAKLGLLLGLSLATKVSAIPLMLPVTLVYGLLFYQARKPNGSNDSTDDRIEKVALRAATAALVAATVYIFCTPYAILAFPEFLEWNLRELDIVKNAGIVPYTVQYVGTPKFLYELQQTTFWGLGLPLGIMAWGGLVGAVVLNIRRPHFPQTLLIIWAISLFLTVGSMEVKFLRYTFPLMPAIILIGSGTAAFGIQFLSQRARLLSIIAQLMVGFVVMATIFYALAFANIYSAPHTAVQASQWVNSNLQTDARVLMDNHWDEGIPNLGRYQVTQLPMFDRDSTLKRESVAAKLAMGDYLIFYSNRTYGAIARDDDRYPMSSAYYRTLFSEGLGYELVKEFRAYPRFLGVVFRDDTFSRAGLTRHATLDPVTETSKILDLGYADNDVITYDHPKVLIFKNIDYLDSHHISELISEEQSVREPHLELMLTSEEQVSQRSGGTWSALFDSQDLSNRFPVAVWLLLVQGISITMLPLGFLVFRGLSDKGYLLNKIMGILIVGYLSWLLAALRIADFSRASILTAFLLIGLVSLIITVLNWRDIIAFVRTRWRVLALEEVLFLVAFFSFLAIRWANPDLWHPFRGGEKPMDFAYLNAIVKSTIMPPYDPWFSGGYLNYYYFGQFIIATLIKASGILPEISYNLALPTLFGLAAGGSFSIVYNLTNALRERRVDNQGPSWGPAAAGVIAVFLVVILGNLGGAAQVIVAMWHTITSSVPFPQFDFWASSRMMPGQISITEFPFWSFLFGDLHAHVIAIPFTLLAVGLSLNLVLISGRHHMRWRSILLPLLILALAVGSLATINTWDYPTYLLLGICSIFLTYYSEHLNRGRLFLGKSLASALFLILVSYVVFLPFHLRHVSFNFGIHSSLEQTDIYHYLGVHGLFIFIVLSYLVYTTQKHLRLHGLTDFKWLGSGFLDRVKSSAKANWPVRLFIPGSGALLIYLLVSGYITVALLFLLGITVVSLGISWIATRDGESPYHLFILHMIGIAIGLGIIVDLVTVNGDVGRMNTVFKLYIQAWVLFGLASATILWHLTTKPLFSWPNMTWPKGLWAGLLLVIMVGVSVFPVLGTHSRLADRFSTKFTGLNGTQYMQYGIYHETHGLISLDSDWDAIAWLRDNVHGSPVIAEGNTAPHNYRWGSRVSIYTGMPTIVGWGWHQTQQRASQEIVIKKRIADVKELFSTADQARAMEILHEYDVTYIYIGKLEKLYYPSEGLEKFRQMEGKGVDTVYTNADVDIYEVKAGIS